MYLSHATLFKLSHIREHQVDALKATFLLESGTWNMCGPAVYLLVFSRTHKVKRLCESQRNTYRYRQYHKMLHSNQNGPMVHRTSALNSSSTIFSICCNKTVCLHLWAVTWNEILFQNYFLLFVTVDRNNLFLMS